MRAAFLLSLSLALAPLAPHLAAAQASPSAAASPAATAPAAPDTAATARGRGHGRGANLTRDEYVERAKHNAEKRFDKMDANHDGILTADERRAARANRRGGASDTQ
ncbi:MAG: hypothetical protein JO001_27205 [Alphaproteobacteria bacterium]|nr:hypothetical protein [Alphaproteobacteria bacterium]